MTTRTPNLIIAGAPKCGTSSLHAYLAQQPQVCAAEQKELHYFTPLSWGGAPGPFEDYLAHFRGCGSERYVLEASPEYLYGGAAVAAAMRERLPDARVIFILREPVERMHSHYRHMQKNMRIPQMPFAEFVGTALREYEKLEHAAREMSQSTYARCARAGRYAPFLERWLATYDRTRIAILFFDDLRADPRALLRDLFAWLDLDPDAETKLDVINKSELIRSRAVHRYARRAYRALRPLLDRSGWLKGVLRKTYGHLNTADAADWRRSAEARALSAFYEPATRELSDLLVRRGHRRLPDWLAATPAEEAATTPARPAVRSGDATR